MSLFVLNTARKQNIISWATKGFYFFIFSFLWAPSRDGLQVIYLLAFFIPISIILLSSEMEFKKYGGWMTATALLYAGFSAISSAWSDNPSQIIFFSLQWWVLATWLIGVCLVFIKHDVNVEKVINWLIVGGAFITISTFVYYFNYTDSRFPMLHRLSGWNVFRNENEIGAFCGIMSLMAFITALQSQSLKRAWLFYFLASITTVGLIASFSRSALLALAILAPVALILIRPPLKIWLPPVLLLIIALVILLSKTDMYFHYMGGRIEGFGGRTDIWIEILRRCKNNLLFGIGLSQDSKIILADMTEFNHAHNAWLDTLYRVGLIGLILSVIHLMFVIRKFSSERQLLPLYMWLGYGCICSFFDGRGFFWEIGAKWFMYWIPLGLIAAVYARKVARTVSE